MSDTMSATAGGGGMEGQVTPDEKAHAANRRHRLRTWFRRWHRRNWLSFYTTLLLVIFALMALAPSIIVTIPAGHVGVLWLRFFGGTVTDTHYTEGVHLIFPWDEMYIYDARLQNTARTYDTISSNGLSMQVEIAVRYRINTETVGTLHKVVGPNYPEILVYPEIGSHARELISRYTPEQLYSETRAFIQAQILQRMVTQLGASLANQSLRGRLVQVQDVLLRSVVLPKPVAAAIERKAEQYQAMLEYDFRIEREDKERQRKQVEAQGIRDFQDIVSRNITPEYLRLRGIEATMALSTSNNSKILIIGGKDGLPVILNTGDMASAPEAPSPTPPSPAALGADGVSRFSSGPDQAPLNARRMDIPALNSATPMPPEGTVSGDPVTLGPAGPGGTLGTRGAAMPVISGAATKAPPPTLAPPEGTGEGIGQTMRTVSDTASASVHPLAPHER